MQYLNSYNESIKSEEELNTCPFIRGGMCISEYIDFLYGMPIKEPNEKLRKIKNIEPILEENSKNTKELEIENFHMAGARIRFGTNASILIIKCRLQRIWAYAKMNLYNSSGLDIYQKNMNGYFHSTVIAPIQGKRVFCESFTIKPNNEVEIYLPSYNNILDLDIAIPSGTSIYKAQDYHIVKPIVFYGNSITQGAAASRTGNSFPNIVSRELDADIVNFSFSGACKGESSMASQIAEMEMCAMVIDYTRNSPSLDEFRVRYPRFYNIIREKHPYIPIILLGGANVRIEYDNCIQKLYEKEVKKGKNTFFISQKDLLSEEEILSMTPDNVHYNDCGMFRMSRRIINILKGRI